MRKDILIDLPEEIADILAGVSDLNNSIPVVMKKVKSLTGTAAWSLLVDESFFQAVSLQTSRNIQKWRFNGGIAGLVRDTGKTTAVGDVSGNESYNEKADGFHNIIIASLLCAPLKVRDEVIGILRVINKKNGAPFSGEDIKLLTDVSLCLGIALERVFLYKKVEEISMTDELTGLYNIRFLSHSLDIEIERSHRYGSLFSVIFMDLDNLRKVNEKYGHLAGSRVLIETSHLLVDNLRKIDIIIRYGGDEFVIILPQTPRDAGFYVAERLRRVIEKNIFMKPEGYALKVTASFGVASFPDDAKKKEDLLNIADKAMFSGKASTKNTVFGAQ
ncbi:MAG: sensor domain-containing diguanylate cyclase [Nitrospiraceae bacterium]|nr:MAG: sensor domain-containing diguanylate cyclase [Nitrospiraceae bacterium]